MSAGGVEISPRLLPGVNVAGVWISVEPTKSRNSLGKPLWTLYLDGPEFEHSDRTLAGWGNAGEMLATALVFLSACGESYAYGLRTGRPGENSDLFPDPIPEWAYCHSEELDLARFEIEGEPQE